MATKTLNTRIQLKYDTWTNWQKTDVPGKYGNLVLLSGEIAICQVPADKTAVSGDASRPQYLMKVGDGHSTFSALQWVSAKAADVYEWAKAPQRPAYAYGDTDLTGFGSAATKDFTTIVKENETSLPTAGAVFSAIGAAIGAISGTDTQYQLVNKGTTFKLQSKEKNEDESKWADVEGQIWDLNDILKGSIAEDETGFVIGNDVYTALAGKADTVAVTPEMVGNLIKFDLNGNLMDSGKKTTDFATADALAEEISDREDADEELQEQITTNANAISAINTTIGTYGDIVTHDVSEFATKAQGDKADTALQKADITTGTTDGTISVGGDEVAVAGLGSAAYTDSSDYVAVDGSTEMTGLLTLSGAPTDERHAATKKYVDDAITRISGGVVFKGTVGVGGTKTTLPAASATNKGEMYKVITDGTYGGTTAKVGDLLISDGTNWVLVPSGDEPSGTVTNIAAGKGLTTADGKPITTSGKISHASPDTTDPQNILPEDADGDHLGSGAYVKYVTTDEFGHTIGAFGDYVAIPVEIDVGDDTASDNHGAKIEFKNTNNELYKTINIKGEDDTKVSADKNNNIITISTEVPVKGIAYNNSAITPGANGIVDIGDDVDEAISTAIGALKVSDISGFGKGKTLATLSETDGKISATFQDIEITGGQVKVAKATKVTEGNLAVLDTNGYIVDSKKTLTVTTTSVSDGTNTFTKYDDTALAGRVATLEAKPGLDKVGTVTSVDTVIGGGLKVTGTKTVNPVVEIDDTVTFIFNCGSSSDVIETPPDPTT